MSDPLDLSEYIDFDLYDMDPQDVFEGALEQAEEAWPDWVPEEGNTEVVLLEALALEVSFLIFALNRAPAIVVESLLGIMGIERSEGVEASAEVTIELSDTDGHTIPAGTMLQTFDPEVYFETTGDLVVDPGSDSGSVTVTAVETGTEPHTIKVGDIAFSTDAVLFLDSAQFTSVPSGGRGPETADEFLQRAISSLDRLSSALVMPSHFADYLRSNPSVARAETINNWDPVGGAGPGQDLGHVTVAVVGSGGTTLPTQVMDEYADEMQAISHINLIVHVVPPEFVEIDVNVEVTIYPTASASAVEEAIEEALSVFLNPETWRWGVTINRNDLIALVDGVTGVDTVDTLTLAESGGALGTGNVLIEPYALVATGTITVVAT